MLPIVNPDLLTIEAVEGIAIVARTTDGRRLLVMSKDVRNLSLTTHTRASFGMESLRTYSHTGIDAHIGAFSTAIWETDPSPPPAIRGIYLPDMSFRALPAPDD